MSKEDLFTVRRAKAEDMKYVRQMVQELADFEKMGSGPELSVEDLIRDAGLDGGQEIFHCYVVELANPEKKTGPFGYAICFFAYSMFQTKSYFLEDLYVQPAMRDFGCGKLLFKEVVRNAKILGCKRVDFHVLGWNPAKAFYEKMGAVNETLHGWHYWRLDEDALDKLLGHEKTKPKEKSLCLMG